MERAGFGAVARMVLGAGLIVVALALSRLLAGYEATASSAASPHATSSSETLASSNDAAADLPLPSLESVKRVASYSLSAKLDPALHEVAGEGTIVFENASRVAKNDLYVHLYLNGFESAQTVFGRRDGSGFRGESGMSRFGRIEVQRFFVREMGLDVWPDDATTEGDPKDRTDIHVSLPRAIRVGEVIHIDMRFKSTLPSVLLRTGFAGSFHMVGQWFPKIAKLESDGTWAHFPFQRFSEFYADFGDYDVDISVPQGFVVGASGALTATRVESGQHVLHYRAEAVHDFAFAAWDAFRELDADADGVHIRCLYPPGFEASARREIEAARGGLRFYGESYGAYPYATLTIVHPPGEAEEAGGMEYPTLITTGGSYLLPYSDTRAVELLTLHELAHQWFYGLVATNENAFPFLDEGITTYAAGEAASFLYGDRPLLWALPISVPAGERLYAKHVASHAPVASKADDFATGSDYAQLVYYRTATLLRSLDRVFPDSARRAVARYARRQRFMHPGPPELMEAFDVGEASTAIGPREALRAGLFDEAALDLSVDGFEPGARVATVRRKGTLALPVDIDVTEVSGEHRLFTWDGRGTSFDVKTNEPIMRVDVDPRGTILLDENLLDNGRGLEAPFAPRIFFASLLLSGALAGVVVP